MKSYEQAMGGYEQELGKKEQIILNFEKGMDQLTKENAELSNQLRIKIKQLEEQNEKIQSSEMYFTGNSPNKLHLTSGGKES